MVSSSPRIAATMKKTKDTQWRIEGKILLSSIFVIFLAGVIGSIIWIIKKEK